MTEGLVEGVRAFNRTVTRRIGVLQDEYLARGRPLGASRVLWEIGHAGTDVRAIRARLDLDSGYLSRLLRRLETEGLVVLELGPADRRVRVVRLTDAGRHECAELDRLSNDLASSLLAPLDEGQRGKLIEAMATVERLLTAGLVTIGIEAPTSDAARLCWQAYFAELDARFETRYDPGTSLPVEDGELIEPAGLLLIARLNGDPVGCGAVKFHDGEPAEFKRLWVSPAVRGLGIGRRILRVLEHHARRHGATAVRLDTNRRLPEAIALYRTSGYVEISAYNREPYAHHWFQKALPSTELRLSTNQAEIRPT